MIAVLLAFGATLSMATALGGAMVYEETGNETKLLKAIALGVCSVALAFFSGHLS